MIGDFMTNKISYEVIETFIFRCEVALANIEDGSSSKRRSTLVLTEAKKIRFMAHNLEIETIATLADTLIQYASTKQKEKLSATLIELTKELDLLATAYKVEKLNPIPLV